MGIGRIVLSSQHLFHPPNLLQLPLNHPPCHPPTHAHLHTSPQGCFVHCWNVCVELCVWPPVTISSPIVWIYSQVADLGSACKLAPQSPGLPQTERLSMRVLKSILKLREVSPLAWELYTVSRKGQVTKHR